MRFVPLSARAPPPHQHTKAALTLLGVAHLSAGHNERPYRALQRDTGGGAQPLALFIFFTVAHAPCPSVRERARLSIPASSER